jgi:hypothetical protein
MHRTTDSLSDYSSLFDSVTKDQALNLQTLENIMTKERVRPSLLIVPAPALLGLASVVSTLVLGEEK